MNDLFKSNIYEADEKIIIVGSCLKNMQPNAYAKLEKMNVKIFDVCLEQHHINMLITKVLGMIRASKIKEIIFATVDKSPHCIQLHYVQDEIKKLSFNIKTTNYVAVDNKLVEITPQTITLSKNLSALQS